MWSRGFLIGVACFGALTLGSVKSAGLPDVGKNGARMFVAKGVVRGIDSVERTITISHEAVSNYMEAMTMPFKVRDAGELTGLHPGDEVSFRLHVTQTESWVDQIKKIGIGAPVSNAPAFNVGTAPQPVRGRNPLWYYQFTNELGQTVSLSDFHGQALAITFIYTRCPLPDYCPRLSRNFQAASQKLDSLAGAPTNWHFLSVSFDSQFDTPVVLKAYGDSYQYDPAHWSFLTGPPDKIAELARLSGVHYESYGGFINHNFRTLIVDGHGHLQTVFPISGDLSDSIVAEMIKAAAATNQPTAR
jgi:protein SCO1/2